MIMVLARLLNYENGPSVLNQRAVDSNYGRCYAWPNVRYGCGNCTPSMMAEQASTNDTTRLPEMLLADRLRLLGCTRRAKSEAAATDIQPG